MSRTYGLLGPLPMLVALALLEACGGSATSPETKPNAYAGSYKGIAAAVGGTGTVAITVGQVSDALTRGPVVHAEGNPNAVQLVLVTNTLGSITLNGNMIAGDNAARVTSTNPEASCTIDFSSQGATGTCYVNNSPTPNETFSAFLESQDVSLTTYCGTQSAGTDPTVDPTATLVALSNDPFNPQFSDGILYLIVAQPGGTPVLYSGPPTAGTGTVSLTSNSSATVYTGTLLGSTTISGTITSGGSGSWAVANPCTPGTLTLSTSALTASAVAGSTTPISLTSVNISNGGGGTLGMLALGSVTYGAGANGWLQATLNSPTTSSGSLALSIAPSGIAAGTYTATVPVIAPLASNSPQTVTVTLTITSPSTLTASPASVTFSMSQGGAFPSSQPISLTSSSSTPITGISNQTSYGPGAAGWLSVNLYGTTTPTTIVLQPSSTLASGSYTAQVILNSSAPSVTVNVTLTVTSGAAPVLTASPASETFSMAQGGTLPVAQTSNLTATSPVSGLVDAISYGSGASGWLGAQLNGTATPTTLSVQPLAAAQALASGTYTAQITVSSTTTAVQVATVNVTLNVSPSSSGTCTITTASLGVLNEGTYASVPITYTGSGCPTAGNYGWEVASGGALPPGLNIQPDADLISGTPTATGSYSFTLEMISSVPGASNPVATQQFSGTVGAETACAIGPATLPNGTVGVSYSQQLNVSAACTTPGDNPQLWSWQHIGNLPPGLDIPNATQATSIILSGTPTAAASGNTYTFGIRFVEGQGNLATATQMYTVTISPAPSGSRVRLVQRRP